MRRARKTGEPTFEEWSQHIEAGVSSLLTTPVSQVMRRRVPVIRESAGEDTLVELMLAHSVHGVPVVDEDDFLVGFVSTTDLVRARHEDGDTQVVEVNELEPGFHAVSATRTAGELMTPVAVDLVEDASLAKAALLMASYHLHQLPVVAESGRVVGIVTATDLLFWMLDRAPHHTSQHAKRRDAREVH
jgi:CBS domain-containing protein